MIKKIIIYASLFGIILISGFTLPDFRKTANSKMVKQTSGYFGAIGTGLPHAAIFYISGGSVVNIQASNSTGGCGTLDLIYSHDTPVVEYHGGWRLKYSITIYTNNGNIVVGSGLLSSGYSWCP